MKEFTDRTIMPFGKYKGRHLEQVPAQYLLWLYDEMGKDPKRLQPVKAALYKYIHDNLDVLHKQAG